MSEGKDIPSVRVDLQGVRRRLDGAKGRVFWKSLEELAETPGFLEFLHREFPQSASEFTDPKGRREFLTLMGASFALAGLTACTKQPEEKIVPYVQMPEQVVPGKPLFFATAVTEGGFARGVLVESHLGRPTKIEGNPDHPASLGATDAIGQAWVLGLYDPDRSQTLAFRGEIRAWGDFISDLTAALTVQKGRKGEGIRILTETVTSPTLAAQIRSILAEYPSAKWHQWDASATASAATAGALGRPVSVDFRFDQADVVLSLESDFVMNGPAALRYTRHFTARRKRPGEQEQNRLYVVESVPSPTGAIAEHRLAVKASEVEAVARAVAGALGAGPAPADHPAWQGWAAAAAKDLLAHGGRSLVLAGEFQTPAVHALAHAINERLGNVGKTVVYGAPVEAQPYDPMASIRALAEDMRAGRVELLVILGGNPVYTAPADLDFASAMDRVPLRVHNGLEEDETSALCHWQIPQAHPLEAWSDARAFDGTATIMQPLIAPLYDSARSPHEVLAAFTSDPSKKGHDIVKDFWRTQLPGDFDRAWARALHDGLVAGWTGPAAGTGPAAATQATAMPAAAPAPPRPAAGGLEIVFRPDPNVKDGRYANLGWLQELPKPITKITWDNAAFLSPATAERLSLANADVVEISYRGRSVRAPVWTLPGQADDTVAVHFGYGRSRAGRVASGTGFNAFNLRRSDEPWFASGAEVRKVDGEWPIACTQDHWTIDKVAEERHVVRSVTLEEYRKEPDRVKEMVEVPPRDETLYENYKYEGHAWGMAIDLNSCVGCNACVVACQAENNIPVVGKRQVMTGREMHWIRVDRYFSGDPGQSTTVGAHFQPVPCMQCENAPCEQVCPVGATVHSDEGLNDQVYNRCIGTRYCSNNCPYKVRRFNFLLFQDWDTPTYKLMRNPDVTVRSRGVMEKCTYCVQRIEQARITARNEGRDIRDGEVQTACQSSCPAEAIVFGDVNDPKSRVSRLKGEKRNYGLLAELNTRPRTTYLAQVKNPNPEMEQAFGPARGEKKNG